MEIFELVKQIKRSFRLYMNGVTSSSMRQKGLEYKINWGVSQMDLRHIAEQYGKNKALAVALWKENIRECKILATLIMPPNEFDANEAVEWATMLSTVEMAEMIVFNLFQYIEEREQLSLMLLTSDNPIVRICAYNLVCRMLKNKAECSPKLYAMLFEKASADLKTTDRQLLHSLVNCLDHVSSSDTEWGKEATQLLKEGGFLDF